MLLLYSYSVGVFSSRKIMARCEGCGVSRDCGQRRCGLSADQRVPPPAPRTHAAVVRGGAVVVSRSGAAEGGAAGSGRDEDQGERISSQGDELRPHDSEEERLQKEIDELLKPARTRTKPKTHSTALIFAATSSPKIWLVSEWAGRRFARRRPPSKNAPDRRQPTRRSAGIRRPHAADQPGRSGSQTEGPAELHRSRIEDHEDVEQGLRSVRQPPRR